MTVIIADPGRAVNYPLEIEQRSKFQAIFTVQNDDGSTMDLTGFNAEMQIRPFIGSPDPPYVDLVSGDGITLGGIAGTITVDIGSNETELFEWRRARYDLYIVDGTGQRQRMFEGEVTVHPTLTTG